MSMEKFEVVSLALFDEFTKRWVPNEGLLDAKMPRFSKWFFIPEIRGSGPAKPLAPAVVVAGGANPSFTPDFVNLQEVPEAVITSGYKHVSEKLRSSLSIALEAFQPYLENEIEGFDGKLPKDAPAGLKGIRPVVFLDSSLKKWFIGDSSLQMQKICAVQQPKWPRIPLIAEPTGGIVSLGRGRKRNERIFKAYIGDLPEQLLFPYRRDVPIWRALLYLLQNSADFDLKTSSYKNRLPDVNGEWQGEGKKIDWNWVAVSKWGEWNLDGLDYQKRFCRLKIFCERYELEAPKSKASLKAQMSRLGLLVTDWR